MQDCCQPWLHLASCRLVQFSKDTGLLHLTAQMGKVHELMERLRHLKAVLLRLHFLFELETAIIGLHPVERGVTCIQSTAQDCQYSVNDCCIFVLNKNQYLYIYRQCAVATKSIGKARVPVPSYELSFYRSIQVYGIYIVYHYRIAHLRRQRGLQIGISFLYSRVLKLQGQKYAFYVCPLLCANELLAGENIEGTTRRQLQSSRCDGKLVQGECTGIVGNQTAIKQTQSYDNIDLIIPQMRSKQHRYAY